MTVGSLLPYGIGIFHYVFIYIKKYFELCPFLFFIYSGINKLDGMVHDTSIS